MAGAYRRNWKRGGSGDTNHQSARGIVQPPASSETGEMFSKAIGMLRSSSQGLLVPSASIEREGQTAYVFVRIADNRFERRKVALGRTVGRRHRSNLGACGRGHGGFGRRRALARRIPAMTQQK